MRNFDDHRGASVRALSVCSVLCLLTALPLHIGCQPSVNASAEGPVQPQTPPAASSPASAPSEVPPPASAPNPEATQTPATTAPTPINPAPTSPAPTTTEAPPAGLPTTIPTTIPTAFPTAVPSTVPPAEPAPATPPPNGRVRTEGDRILLPGNIVFETGKTVLNPTPENLTVLKQLQQFLTENPKVTQIRVEGYTDNVGKPEGNLKLSGERALAIKRWLVSQGVAEDRVLAVGFGQEKPVADNSSPAGRAQNRRTEFKIATVNGRLYRGVPVLGGGTEFK